MNNTNNKNHGVAIPPFKLPTVEKDLNLKNRDSLSKEITTLKREMLQARKVKSDKKRKSIFIAIAVILGVGALSGMTYGIVNAVQTSRANQAMIDFNNTHINLTFNNIEGAKAINYNDIVSYQKTITSEGVVLLTLTFKDEKTGTINMVATSTNDKNLSSIDKIIEVITAKNTEIKLVTKNFITLKITADGGFNGPTDIKFTDITSFTADWNYDNNNKTPSRKIIRLKFIDNSSALVNFTDYDKTIADLEMGTGRVSPDFKITYLRGNSRQTTNIDTIESYAFYGTSNRYLLLRIKGGKPINILESVNPKPLPGSANSFTSIDNMGDVLGKMGVTYRG